MKIELWIEENDFSPHMFAVCAESAGVLYAAARFQGRVDPAESEGQR
jgi:hypothetical protein